MNAVNPGRPILQKRKWRHREGKSRARVTAIATELDVGPRPGLCAWPLWGPLLWRRIPPVWDLRDFPLGRRRKFLQEVECGHQLRKGLLQNAFSLWPWGLQGQWDSRRRGECGPGWGEGEDRSGGRVRAVAREAPPQGQCSWQPGIPLCVLTFRPVADN